ncbi:hypothetical protein OAN29_00885 [Pelagibacteraceae bacterium]|nr:hypothetical protein [Pelagibacteraceae bacterium]
MKKLLIILISIFFNTYAHALLFEKCMPKLDKKRTFEEMHKEKYEYRISFEKGKILETNIYKDKWLKKFNSRQEVHNRIDKIMTKIWDINYFDEKFIKAQSADGNKLLLKLDHDGPFNVEEKMRLSGSFNINCEIKKQTSSNFLDYWWAVILIIAITFFIFTQSGKRLKQIRRK